MKDSIDPNIQSDQSDKPIPHIKEIPYTMTDAIPFHKLGIGQYFYESWHNGTAKYEKVTKSKAKCLGATAENPVHPLGKEQVYSSQTKCIVLNEC